jgi:hypothetical protein
MNLSQMEAVIGVPRQWVTEVVVSNGRGELVKLEGKEADEALASAEPPYFDAEGTEAESAVSFVVPRGPHAGRTPSGTRGGLLLTVKIKGGLLDLGQPTYAPTEPAAGTEVELTAPHVALPETVDILRWNWQFGDGDESVEQRPTHKYYPTAAGTTHYEASVEITLSRPGQTAHGEEEEIAAGTAVLRLPVASKQGAGGQPEQPTAPTETKAGALSPGPAGAPSPGAGAPAPQPRRTPGPRQAYRPSPRSGKHSHPRASSTGPRGSSGLPPAGGGGTGVGSTASGNTASQGSASSAAQGGSSQAGVGSGGAAGAGSGSSQARTSPHSPAAAPRQPVLAKLQPGLVGVLLDSHGITPFAMTPSTPPASTALGEALKAVATEPRSSASTLSALGLTAALAAVVAALLLGALGELRIGWFGRFVR